MSVQERKVRERAQRERLIVAAARELAESDGWDAVTTRRLAERIEYSQPVLYSHFAGKDAIVAAVALEGFVELARALARPAAADPRAAVATVARRYLAFADANPALYDAMFNLRTDLPFGREDTPAPLRAAFAAIQDVLAPVAGGRDSAGLAELMWSALHGIATLGRGGRLPPEYAGERIDLLVELVTGQ
ncbi:MAG TPA: TetR/AcrR family transcriptional regulator [Pseudonocardiaceae bacterium]|jgi:AcrR family transcriptional regulator|nr:TetR/AcrR family transcriptional regulator [Pseudonocardiaceae bacterium]